MSQSLAKTAVKGTIWSAVGKFGVMAIQFMIYVVLARLLTPADFGAIGMLMIFIIVCQTFVDSGFSSALVQKKDTTQLDYSTVFFWSLAIGIAIFSILFFSAPYIANFYNMPVLSPVLRVFGVNVIFAGTVGTQVARLQKTMQFRAIACVDISTYILAAAISIYMAKAGFGVWALVALNLCQTIGKSALLYIITRWLPSLSFSRTAFKELFRFGGFHFLSYLMETISSNVQGMVIGKKFSASQMGYYSQAARLENITGLSIPQIIAQVMYPIFSKFQDDKVQLRAIVTTDHRIISFLIYPLLTILIILAPDVISFIYGNQWGQAVPYYRILMAGGFFICLKNINSFAVAACGKSKSLFYASIFQWIMLAALLTIGCWFGMLGIMWALALNMFNIFISYAIASRIHTGQHLSIIFKALLPSAATCALSSAIVVPIYTFTNIWWPICGILFIVIYFGAAYLLKVKAFFETKSLLMHIIRK